MLGLGRVVAPEGHDQGAARILQHGEVRTAFEEHLVEAAGGYSDSVARLVVGGPMMGFATYSLDAPVVKATSGILVLTAEESEPEPESACINCGKCIDACPINLLPTRLVKLAKLQRWEETRDLGVEVCMECGTCAFTCPAHIPLVQYLRVAKKNVRTLPRKES